MNEQYKEFEKLLSSPDINDIKNCYNSLNIPDTLFKFRPININSLENFTEATIWCDNLCNQNDLFEGNLTFEHDDIYIESLKKDTPKLNNLDNKIFLSFIRDRKNKKYKEKYEKDKDISYEKIKTLIEKIKTSTKICSFSQNKDNILMWAHYADGFRGFCLEYSTKDIIKNIGLVFPVLYSEKVLNITNDIISFFKGSQSNSMLPYRVALYKNEIWKYENEWRVILLDSNQNKYSIKPISIYFGCNMNSKIKCMLAQYANTNNIDVFDTSWCNKEYKIDIKKYQND